jgi:hypothetical protein
LAGAIVFAWRGRHSWPNTLFAPLLSLTGLWALTVVLANSGYAEWDRGRNRFSSRPSSRTSNLVHGLASPAEKNCEQSLRLLESNRAVN